MEKLNSVSKEHRHELTFRKIGEEILNFQMKVRFTQICKFKQLLK